MGSEMEVILTGAFATILVCIVTGVLFYMFRHASVPSVIVSHSPTVTVPKKKRKKLDFKKARHLKQTASTDDGSAPSELECDKSQTSDETTDDLSPIPTPDYWNVSQQSSPCEETQSPLNRSIEKCADGSSILNDENDEHREPLSGDRLEQSVSPKSNLSHLPFQNTSCHVIKEKNEAESSEFLIESFDSTYHFPLGANPHSNTKSRRSRRRAAKKILNSLSSSTDVSVPLHIPNVEHVVHPVEEVTKSTGTVSHKPTSDLVLAETQEEVTKLTDLLRATESKLQEISMKAAEVSIENERLRQKEEENTLGLRVLQQQYTELLRINKTVEHEKQNLATEKKNLLCRVDQLVTESSCRKKEVEAEVRKLQEQLLETQTKLAALATAPPCPSPEMLISNENVFLKSSLGQLEAELTQLRQASLIQQQELQLCIVENHKLRDNQEAALEKLHAKHEVEKAESASRITAFETQLQLHRHDLEVEKQEFVKKLTEARAEISVRVDREKRLSEMIANLECQFADLRVEKQCLLEMMETSKAISEGSNNELLAQVANLTNELTRTTLALHDAQRRVDLLATELESIQPTVAQVNKKDAYVCTERSIFNGDTESKLLSSVDSKHSTEHLRSKLRSMKQQLKASLSEAFEARKSEEQARLELDHYKLTLLQTEKLLAKLQNFVEDAERKWRRLLSESQSECVRVKDQLACALSDNTRVTDQLRHAQQQLTEMKKESVPSKQQGPHRTNDLPKSDESLLIQDLVRHTRLPDYGEAEASQMLDLPDTEVDDDLDAVLVDDTDLNVPDDIWNESAKTSDNFTISEDLGMRDSED